MKSVVNRSAVVATAVGLGCLIILATPSIAETPLQTQQPSHVQSQNPQPQIPTSINEAASTEPAGSSAVASETEAKIAPAVTLPVAYVATAYSLRGRTASGKFVTKGIIAADHRVLPLGSRVRLDAGGYSGEYLVADTGGAIRGRRIDIWTPSSREAMRFGRRTVKLTVLSYPVKRAAKGLAKIKRVAR
jgi:3D (Asp-Asp-Asp) domain-containing protein